MQRLGECLLHLVTYPTHVQLYILAKTLQIAESGACAYHCRDLDLNIVSQGSITCVEPLLYRLLFACMQAFPIAACRNKGIHQRGPSPNWSGAPRQVKSCKQDHVVVLLSSNVSFPC